MDLYTKMDRHPDQPSPAHYYRLKLVVSAREQRHRHKADGNHVCGASAKSYPVVKGKRGRPYSDGLVISHILNSVDCVIAKNPENTARVEKYDRKWRQGCGHRGPPKENPP